MHMKQHYGRSNIQNILMFAFNNFVLLGCIRARCLVINPFFRTEDRHIIFNILLGIVSLKHTYRSRILFFCYFIEEEFNDIRIF